MKTIVFGAAGFIGQNLTRSLSASGLDIAPCDIVVPAEGHNEFLSVDITQYDQVEAVLRDASSVIFLAAHSLPDSIVDPRRNLQVNLSGLLNVLDALRKGAGGKVLFASASSVYGNPPAGAVPENTPCSPKTPYAVSKYASEHYLRVFKELYGLDYVAFRLFNVYGPGQYPHSRALIPRVLELIMNQKEVEIFGDGSQSRDFIFVNDVSKIFEKALRSKATGEIVNLGTGKLTSVAEIVTLCAEVTGIQPRVKRSPARKGEISNFCADTSKLDSLFRKHDAIDISVGLKRTYDWLSAIGSQKTKRT